MGPSSCEDPTFLAFTFILHKLPSTAAAVSKFNKERRDLTGSAEPPSLFVLHLQGRTQFLCHMFISGTTVGLEEQGRPRMGHLGSIDPSICSNASAEWSESDRHCRWCMDYTSKISSPSCSAGVCIQKGNFVVFFPGCIILSTVNQPKVLVLSSFMSV